MALIKCSECGKEFSEYAERCPQCGCPKDKAFRANMEAYPNPKTSNRKILWYIIAAIICILGIGAYFLKFNSNAKEITELSDKEVSNAIQKLAKVVGKYDAIEDFHDGLAVVRQGKKYGCINVYGEEVVSCVYDVIGDFSEGFAYIKKGDLWGFINTNGKVVIPCRYIEKDGLIPVRSFSEGLAAVSENGKWGYINVKGELTIPCQFDFAQDFHEGLATVIEQNVTRYINNIGKSVIPFEYKGGLDFSDGMALVEDDLGQMFINKTGEPVFFVDCKEYFHTNSFHEDLALVESRTDYKKGYINKEGTLQVPCIYLDAADFNEGMAVVCDENNRLGYINTMGGLIIPCIYESGEDDYGMTMNIAVHSFSEDLAAVCQDSKWGYIDKQGNVVVSLEYDFAGQFSEGLARVRIGKTWGYIDKQGNSTLSN